MTKTVTKAVTRVSLVTKTELSGEARRTLTSVKMLGAVTSRLSLPALSSSLLTVIGPGDV